MKNRIFSLVLLIAIVISAVSGLVACVPSGEPTQLKAPSVTLIDNVVHWTSVEGATGYEISIGLAVTTVGKDVTSQVLELGDSFMVRAVGDGEKYLTSAWSSTITYGEKPADPGKEALATPVVTLNGDVASWGAVDGAVGYEVSIGASTVITLDANTTAYTLTLGQSIVVRAMAAAGAEKTHSAWSAIVKYTDGGVTSCTHADEDENGKCDSCQISVVVVVDFYSINDLHGKFCDSNTQPGVDELASYLKGRESIDDNVVVLSAGDMWQGTAESSLTYGKLMTEWMNIIGTVGMTLGNHEFDWGEEYIKENLKIADFPFLALNIYNRTTGKLADYCTPSIIIEEGGIEIGIIGAIGDCYSSILSDMVTDVEFKTGNTLTALVKAESERLRALGADIIVYSLHDSTTGCDASLSAGGYVDLVFEGHSHTSYCTKDVGGVYHIQAGGENKGISHAELSYNIVTKKLTTTEANIISSSTYSAYEDDPETEALEDKYGEIIELVTKPLGKVGKNLSDSEVEDIVAELYFKAGQEKWGDDYAITLGGGFLKTRSPYDLAAGTVTYGDLVSLLPFNNQLVLCSIKGSDLLSRFIETENGDYHVYYEIQASSIVSSATYYVVVDTYTSAYAANRLTVIERYDETTFARDLFAEYIEAGGLDNAHKNCAEKTITEVIELGSQMSLGSFTTIPYHVTGIIKSISNATSGILYITDGAGHDLYVYRTYNSDGVQFGSMSEKPKVGDTVTLCAVICNYNSNGTALLELKDAIIVETSETLTPPAPTPLELGIPTVTLGEGSVIWSAVAGATSYEFYIGTSRFEFDTPMRIPLEAGDTFKVRALGDGTTYEAAGEWSAVYTYTVQKTALETPVVNLNEALASWAAVSGATAYEVKIGSAAPIRVTATNYTLKSGDTISVRAIADTASNYLDSAWSVAVTYTAAGECNHTDTDNNGKCDSCQISVVVVVDFYSINDLHGKFCDSNTQPGVDELASYLKGRESIDDNVVVLSAGDMWQGTAESSLTYGKLMTEWMNIIGTVGMTLGNHEYDWGEDYIRENLKIADFPFLAINIYDRSTGELADYCTPSVMIEEGGIDIGIIGAIGDCYSSILSTMVAGVEFKTGSALTSLVKAESERLREAGADIIVYTWHSSTSGYDYSLSSGGYVDLVFEGHSHTTYCNEDSYGVFHIQAGGENQGISHAELSYNIATKKLTTTEANIIASSTYSAYEDDADTEALEDKYGEIIDAVTTPLGTVDSYMSSDAVTNLVAKLYFEAGVKRWGSRYTITLGGAYLQTRSPYSLSAGAVTYGDLFSLLPFNNQLVLCSIKGSDLISRFINASGNYHVYFEVASSSIDRNATYYVVTDTYTSTYAQNNMTEIEYYDDTTYARDLLAEYIKTGSVGSGGSGSGSGNTGGSDPVVPDTPTDQHAAHSTKTIAEALAIAAGMDLGYETVDLFHVTGTIEQIEQSTYGNCYINDGAGNRIFVYGIYDANGNKYNTLADKPVAGDTVTLCSIIANYDDKGTSKPELKAAVLIGITRN